MQLYEKIRKIVRKVLNEELGINQDVANAVDDIIDMLANINDSDLMELSVTDFRHYPYKLGSIDYQFVNGRIVHVAASFYDFPDIQSMEDFKRDYPKEYRKVANAVTRQTPFSQKISISLSIIRVNGEIIPQSYSNMQHELTHAFQRIMTGKSSLVKNYSKYRRNIEILKNTTDEYLKKAACINYWSYPHEMDAFVNGLDAEIRVHLRNGDGDLDDIINNTRFYYTLDKIKKIVNDFSKLEDYEKDCVESALQKQFHCGVDAIIRRGEKTAREYTRGMGRVKMRYINSF